MKKFKSSLVRIHGHLVDSMIGLGLRCDWPILVAIAWRVAMHPARKVKARSCGPEKLVVLSKSAGVEDIQNAYTASMADYAVVFLPRWVVKRSGRFWLGNRVSNSNYDSSDATLETGKRLYRAHLVKVLKWFQRLFGVSAVAQFNVVYWAERELAAACVEQGVRFVALHKECLWAPELIDKKVKLYSHSVGPFGGSAISVYNSVSKKIFLAAGTADEGKVHILGCSRLDESHRYRRKSNLPQTRTVLFYLIQPNAGLSAFIKEDSGERIKGVPMADGSIINWHKMVEKVNAGVMDLATTNPNIQFICKGKTGFVDQQLGQLKEASIGSSLPDNVDFIAGGVGHKLIEKVSVVIGFNTTSVLEAMAAGVPTIVPNIFSEQEKRIAGYAQEVNEGALIATTTDQLKFMVLDVLETGFRYKELTQGQKKVLDRMLGNSDGKSGERLRAFLDKSVYDQL